MKYMILTYGSQHDYDLMSGKAGDSGLTPADFAPMYEFMGAYNRKLAESGELVETRGLTAPVLTRRMGSRNGVPFVTDGPYAETQEVLAGYWVIDVDGIDRAMEIANELAQCPSPGDMWKDSYVDLRPIMESADEFNI